MSRVFGVVKKKLYRVSRGTDSDRRDVLVSQ